MPFEAIDAALDCVPSFVVGLLALFDMRAFPADECLAVARCPIWRLVQVSPLVSGVSGAVLAGKVSGMDISPFLQRKLARRFATFDTLPGPCRARAAAA